VKQLAAAESATRPEPGGKPIQVLDTASYWRCLFVHSPSIARIGDRIEVTETNVHCRSTDIPRNWMDPEYDEGIWTRQSGPFAAPATGLAGKAVPRG